MFSSEGNKNMLDLVLIILIFLAIIMMLITYTYREPWAAFSSAIIWLICTIGSMRIDIPYQIYNSSANKIVATYYTFIDPGVSVLFLIFAVVMFISFASLTLEEFGKAFHK